MVIFYKSENGIVDINDYAKISCERSFIIHNGLIPCTFHEGYLIALAFILLILSLLTYIMLKVRL